MKLIRLCMYFLVLWLFLSQTISAQNISYEGKIGEIRNLINNRYLDSVHIDSLIREMVNAYLNEPETINKLLVSLDPHSYYFTEEEYRYFQEDMGGTFGGVGLVFNILRDTVTIVQIIEGGPAEKAGLKPGDKILAIDTQSIAGKNLQMDDIFPLLRGKKDAQVKILLLNGQTKQANEFILIRDQIRIKSIEAAYMLDNITGYIRLTGFIENGNAEMHNALQQLKNAGMKNLILDLRNNFGGYFEVARKIADEFLSENKLIVYTEGFHSPRSEYYATNEGLFETGKMVVLVNGETASSGEILTGALQDQKRAVVIGTRTYGKGLIQKMYTLSDSVTALKLTVSKYYTPNGRCIQRPYTTGSQTYFDDFEQAAINSANVSAIFKDDTWGIHPDIFIPEDTASHDIVLRALLDRNYLQSLAFAYYADHIHEFSSYRNPDELMQQFNQTEKLYAELKKLVPEKENLLPEEERINYTDDDFLHAKPEIQNLIKAYLAYELWGYEGLYRIKNIDDPDVLAALLALKK